MMIFQTALASLFLVQCSALGSSIDFHALLEDMKNEIHHVKDTLKQVQKDNAVLHIELEDVRQQLSIKKEFRALQEEDVKKCSTRTVGDNFYFTGCNVHIQNGEGATNTTNGVGNLIVGYNENENLSYDKERTGSHIVVVGKDHEYTSYGGIVVGKANAILAPYASVSGGKANTAFGEYASVSGGYRNFASGDYSSVSGGYGNDILEKATYASVSGGGMHEVSGELASISGGYRNYADGYGSSILGGVRNTAGDYHNPSQNKYVSISGGNRNIALANFTSVTGGRGNTATDNYSSVLGGKGSNFYIYNTTYGYACYKETKEDECLNAAFEVGIDMKLNDKLETTNKKKRPCGCFIWAEKKVFFKDPESSTCVWNKKADLICRKYQDGR